MKNNLRSYCAAIIALVSIFFAPTLMAQSATKQAYVVQVQTRQLSPSTTMRHAPRTVRKAGASKKLWEVKLDFPTLHGQERAQFKILQLNR